MDHLRSRDHLRRCTAFRFEKVFITENKNNLISKRPEVHCLVGFNVHRFQWTTLYILPENVHQRPELYLFGSQDLNTAFALLNVLTLKDDCANIQQLAALHVLQSGERGTRLSQTHANGAADSKSASDWLKSYFNKALRSGKRSDCGSTEVKSSAPQTGMI